MRTLLLNPPSFGGFDGGAGARYQARREIRSFWYPLLAYLPGLLPKAVSLMHRLPIWASKRLLSKRVAMIL